MSNNMEITIHDFKNICRTCLSKADLKPLYEKCYESICLVDMLTSFTFVEFTEVDGLPVQICTNCIHEINQAFSFVKRCETTDTILRKCIKKFETVAPKIKVEEEMESNPEIIHQIEEVLWDYESVEEIKQEENAIIDVKPEIVLLTMHRTEEEALKNDEEQEVKIECEEFVEEVKQIEDVNIENEWDGTYDDLADESYEEDIGQDLPETYFEKSDNSDSRHRHKFSLDPISTVQTCDRAYACQVYGKAFNEIGHLNKPIHTNEKHICSVCSKTFINFKNLKRHMGTHSGEKPYICEVCSKAFNQTTSLNYHMRIHTGEKPFICEVCSRAFSQSSHLNVHARIHTGEKPYSCGVCNKAFIQSNSLKLHMRIHIGEKPYTCTVCSKAFTQSNSLKRHMRTHM